MSAPRGDAPAPPEDESRATTLGIILIAVAVLIGFVLLAKGFDQEDGVAGTAAKPAGQTTTTTAGAAAPDQTTTTVGAASAPGEVTVMVANGSGGAGQASANAAILEEGGYVDVGLADAPLQETSIVYYAEGAQADAAAVARVLGITAAPEALPASPPVDPAGASVLVIIGSDKI